jgi:protein TonB
MTAKTLRREPVNLGAAFSVVFHTALILYLVYMVHPHVSFLSPPASVMPTVDLAPPAPPAPPKLRTTPPKPVPPQPQAPAADTAPPAPSEQTPSPPRVVGTVVPPSYFSALESLIQKSLQYPARSVANDEEGGCTVRVTFSRDGAIESTMMQKNSGYGALDGECREVFRRIGHFPPVPSDTSPDSTDFAIELPITFSLQ